MSDIAPQFETQDLDGTTDHFNGTVNTTPINVPSVAGGVIAEVMLHVPRQPGSAIIEISFDGGVSYFEVEERNTIVVPTKGGITQIKIKSGGGTRSYQIIMNRELS